MRVLILGASGMFGNALFRALSGNKNLNVFGTIRNQLLLNQFDSHLLKQLEINSDINDYEDLSILFNKCKPDVVINCVGEIKKNFMLDANNAIKTNSLLPHRLAYFSDLFGFRFIHISTDCVFSGKKGNYCETDFADANDSYGISKFLGEIIYRPNCLTLRTSIIGHELITSHGLLNWFLLQEDSVPGYTHAIFSGLPTIELSDVIEKYIIFNPALCGLYHISSDPIDKYSLLRLISAKYQKDIKILPYSEVRINRSLNSHKFRTLTGYNAPDWKVLIEKMYQFG